ncbi:MAG: 3-deoxy-D-manno-octulosonic acid transferase, partial [Ignavibacteria bacterium]
MNNFWILFYNYLIIPIFYLTLKFASLFNNKIRTALRDRKKLFSQLENDFGKLNFSKKVVWFHSSSVGEFEQAKPIIEKINSNKDYFILPSFLSPSGYNAAKRYDRADLITYYPFDSKKNVQRFVDIIKPSILIYMRYDIWPNSVFELEKRKIPVVLVDATMKKNSPRKIFIVRNFHKFLFNKFEKILTISDEDRKGFVEIGVKPEKIEVAGDTRYDRVYQKSQSALKQKILNEKIIEGRKIFVAGSTWKEDEEVLFPALIKLHKYERNLISIIVPHEPSIPTLEQIEFELNKNISTIRFSALNQYRDEKIIIVDSVGILLILYAYADVAFVGGGFKSNIHNVLEPAVYGIPVLFGPKFSNSQEAFHLISNQGGFSVNNK